MSARSAGRSTGCLVALTRAARAGLRAGRRAALVAILIAFAGPGGYAAIASSPRGDELPGPSAAAARVWCPTFEKLAPTTAGRPVKALAGVGSTQATPAGTQFPIPLTVTVTDAARNPVANVRVTFSAPSDGASGSFTVRSRVPKRGRFRISHPRVAQVETDACGIAVAPPFTADRQPGGYIVRATVRHLRAVAFALVNEAS